MRKNSEVTETIIHATTTTAADSIATELARAGHELDDSERGALTAGIQCAIQAALDLTNVFRPDELETEESDEVGEQ